MCPISRDLAHMSIKISSFLTVSSVSVCLTTHVETNLGMFLNNEIQSLVSVDFFPLIFYS